MPSALHLSNNKLTDHNLTCFCRYSCPWSCCGFCAHDEYGLLCVILLSSSAVSLFLSNPGSLWTSEWFMLLCTCFCLLLVLSSHQVKYWFFFYRSWGHLTTPVLSTATGKQYIQGNEICYLQSGGKIKIDIHAVDGFVQHSVILFIWYFPLQTCQWCKCMVEQSNKTKMAKMASF